MTNTTRRLTAAERRLRKMSQLTTGLTEEVLRGFFMEFMLDEDGEGIFEWLNEDMKSFCEYFSKKWENFQDYGREGHFE